MNQNMVAQSVARVMPAVRASGLLASLATFQSSDAADFPDGFSSGEYLPIAGLVDLPCIASPQDTSYVAADEVKAVQMVTAEELLHVSFGTVYPALDAGWRTGWRVEIDSVDYDVVGVGQDSQGQHSVCRVRLVSI